MNEQNDQVRRTEGSTQQGMRQIKKKPRVYLAGPFFNPDQVAQAELIERFCEEGGLDFFSPRLQHREDPKVVQPVPKIKSAEVAQRVFDKNFEAIEDCSHMFAVLDFRLPNPQRLAVVKDAKMEGLPCDLLEEIRSINLPDTGTVWEMGVAYALRRPVVGILLAEHGYMNLMITQSMQGVVSTEKELRQCIERLVKHGEFRAGGWTGSYR